MLMNLLENDGFYLNRVASTNGGEYAGACPWCGGTDRFRVWPENERYWCRQCGHSGDAIQYIRDFRNLGFHDACALLGATPELRGGYHASVKRAKFEPRRAISPGGAWQDKAKKYLYWCQQQLWGEAGREGLEWLRNERGLEDRTIKKSGLGWCPNDFWRKREEWGLHEELKDNGETKKLWLPAGLVIPYQINGLLSRVRIRRPNSGDNPRYYLIPGSDTRFMAFTGSGAPVILIVESELDGILVNQAANDLVSVMALGSAMARPDQEAHRILDKSESILVALDRDNTGAKQAWEWWLKQYPQARRWPPVKGKDPGEMLRLGIDIRDWVKAGLDMEL